MSVAYTLAELESLPVRSAWPHEAQHFTPWLEANLDRLSAAIAVPLELVDAKAVSDAQIADLLARDRRDGSLVLIENQLEVADHLHLGQILAYLAAIDAKTAVWIASRFNDPQLAAMRWLNAKTSPAHGFFAVRIRIVRIGASALAPVFDVLERPASSSISGPQVALGTPDALSGFASAFWAWHLQRHPDEVKVSRPVGERCRWRATKPSGVVIGQLIRNDAAIVFLRGRNGVPLTTVREALAPFADELERRLGVALHADSAAIIAAKSKAIDVVNPAHWGEVSDWLRVEAGRYDATLRELVRNFAAAS